MTTKATERFLFRLDNERPKPVDADSLDGLFEIAYLCGYQLTGEVVNDDEAAIMFVRNGVYSHTLVVWREDSRG